MSRVDLNFDAREVCVVSRNLYDIDVKAEGAILEEVITSIGESVILDEIGVDKLIEYLDGEGYAVEEVDEE